MEITFTKNSERTYATLVSRNDGVTIQVPAYDRQLLLPHDIAHYVVERELGIAHGFWGCVAAGALFPNMKIVSGRQRPHAADRSREIIKEAGQRTIEAEMFVSVLLDIMHRGLEENWSAVYGILREVWKPSQPSRESLNVNEARRICRMLREFEERWLDLPIGESLTFSWRQPSKIIK